MDGLWQRLEQRLEQTVGQRLEQSAEPLTSPLPKLLTAIEQISIFEEIITHSPLEYPLLRREATAKLAVEAWTLCRQWDLSYQADPVMTEDNHTYLQWESVYREKCKQENWIDEAVILDYLGAALQQKILTFPSKFTLSSKVTLPSKIACFGFEEWTPQQKRFLGLCEAQGVQIEMHSLLKKSNKLEEWNEAVGLHGLNELAKLSEAVELHGLNKLTKWNEAVGLEWRESNKLTQWNEAIELHGTNELTKWNETVELEWQESNKSTKWSESGEREDLNKTGEGDGLNKTGEKDDLNKTIEVTQLGFSNEEEELTVALQSARAWSNKNPRACIGVIIPNLEQKRFAVLRLLGSICSPKDYNIAAPISLAQYPMIDAALLALNLMSEDIPFEQFSKLLRLVFFAVDADEMCQAAELEIQLRNLVRPQHSLEEYVFFLKSIQSRFPKLMACSLISRLKKCLELRSRFFGKQSAEHWQTVCIDLLNCLGWPGTRNLNEEELALKKHWDELLIEYSQLGQVLSDHHYSEALKQMRRLAIHKQFLAQSHPHHCSIDAPIQVLGLLEGLGFPFDYLWVLGLHRDAWPKEPAPNPFIPLSLQIAHHMPRSSAARELEVAERMTQQLSCAAKKVVFSYPAVVLEQPTSMSPLIANFPEVSDREIHDLRSQYRTQFESQSQMLGDQVQDQVQDQIMESQAQIQTTDKNQKLENPSQIMDIGPPLVEHEYVRGGTNILKLQAICPFRAFAEIRLKVTALKNPSLGLTPAERGEILHQILMIFWRGLKDQAALLALTEEQRQDRIEEAMNQVFAKWKTFSRPSRSSRSSRSSSSSSHHNHHDHHSSPRSASHFSPCFSSIHSSFTERYLSLEQNRMLILVQRFLSLEESRPPFEVLAHEVSQELILGGIHFKLRIDRIDKLENGDELLIDYKTGQVQVSEWFGTRPLAPQLPLYCIARKTKASAVAFAIIRPDEVRYKGLRSDEIPGERSDHCKTAVKDFPEISEISEIPEILGIPGIEISAKLKRYGAEESWTRQNLAWEQDLEALALEFKRGEALVNPLKGEQSCRSCHLNSLCRNALQ